MVHMPKLHNNNQSTAIFSASMFLYITNTNIYFYNYKVDFDGYLLNYYRTPSILYMYYKKLQIKQKSESCIWRMFCAETVERIFTSFHIFNYLG